MFLSSIQRELRESNSRLASSRSNLAELVRRRNRPTQEETRAGRPKPSDWSFQDAEDWIKREIEHGTALLKALEVWNRLVCLPSSFPSLPFISSPLRQSPVPSPNGLVLENQRPVHTTGTDSLPGPLDTLLMKVRSRLFSFFPPFSSPAATLPCPGTPRPVD